MSLEEPNILIGTLYSGENEFEECKQSIKIQKYKKWDHFVLKNLPNKEAHKTLYNKFMDEAENYDLFVKLDADMVFKKKTALDTIVNYFALNTQVDHLVTPVHDWYTDSLIIGLHIFSNKTTWQLKDENLFVDPCPETVGQKEIEWDDPGSLVYHSPNPSLDQAFQFGLHRAKKVVQHNNRNYKFLRGRTQWKTLKKVYNNYQNKKDERLFYALWGAYLIMTSQFDVNIQYKDVAFSTQNSGDFKGKSEDWLHNFDRDFFYLKSVGLLKIATGLYRDFSDILGIAINKWS